MKEPRNRAAKVATPTDRFRTVIKNVFGGSQTVMARSLGCSPSMISRVVAGEKEPGPRLLMALASFPGISRRWALTGQGEPLSSLGPEPVAGDAMLPIARQLVPGHLEAYREFLTDACLPVLRRDYSRSRYWLVVDNDDHAERGLLPGDAILVESDGSWLSKPLLLRGKWCVLLPNTDGAPLLRRIEDDEYPETVIVDSPSVWCFPETNRRRSMGIVQFRAVPTRPDQEHARHEGKRGVGRDSTVEKSKGKRNRNNVSTAAGISTEAHAAAGGDGGKAAETEVHWDVVVGVGVLLQRRWPWG
jgi:hypothetical protein